ncbi:glutamate receptor-like [Palaemon carinicauda]|uniref:glutamate receptor-like n=1 Tax=Palaemon carinicauda TaxID=392227 RepID=UPI0035B6948F
MIPGVVNSNGTWNGAFGVLQREEADFTTTSAIFDEKLKISDYVRVYTMDQFIIVSLKPQELPRYLVIIRPFEAAVWVSILISIIVWAISLWALQKAYSSFATEEAMSLTTALFYSTATFLEDPPSRLPTNFPGQILVVWWLIVCLLLSTGYRSSLVAHLTVQGKTSPIDDYYDLVSKEKWQWGCDRIVLYGIAASYFKKSTTPVVKQIAKQVESVDIEAGLKKVLNGQYSLLTSRNRISTVIESKYANDYGQTPFYLSKGGYYLSPDLGWCFRKGAPIHHRFAQLANRLIEGGIIDYWLKDVMALNIKRNQKQQNEQNGKPDSKEIYDNVDDSKVILRMEHLIGVFLTFLLGIFIGCFVFLAEKVSGRFHWYKN